jgi:hypothetical protein
MIRLEICMFLRYTDGQKVARSETRMNIKEITWADVMKDHPYPNFAAALLMLGTSSIEVARALGVSQRSAHSYMRGRALPRVEVVKRHPTIDKALTLDLSPKVTKKDRRVQETAENMS